MTDHEHFSIRHVPEALVGAESKCPVCAEGHAPEFLAVCDERGDPLCGPCAWAKDRTLAGILCLCDLIERRHAPDDVDWGEPPVGPNLTEAQKSLHDNDHARGQVIDLLTDRGDDENG